MIILENELSTLNLKAGRLCLDFANTADWHASDQPEEELHSYNDLLAWAKKVGALTEVEAQQLAGQAGRHPDQAVAALAQAITLREAIYAIFAAVTRGQPAKATDLAILNQALADTLNRLELVSTGKRFTWQWVDNELALNQLLWPIVRSAAALLTSEDLARVGQCADDRGCGWLFLDTSRNHSRRWCDIKDCGNRAKAKRHYARQKQSVESHK
jgi:predicted RNA-binding Zn ribbon-like protein